jgi:hypothetical protein
LAEGGVGAVKIGQDIIERAVGRGLVLSTQVDAVEVDFVLPWLSRIEGAKPMDKVKVFRKITKAVAKITFEI